MGSIDSFSGDHPFPTGIRRPCRGEHMVGGRHNLRLEREFSSIPSSSPADGYHAHDLSFPSLSLSLLSVPHNLCTSSGTRAPCGRVGTRREFYSFLLLSSARPGVGLACSKKAPSCGVGSGPGRCPLYEPSDPSRWLRTRTLRP